MSGYIKLYRATCDHPLFKRDMAYLGAWSWLLSRAAWKPHQAKHRKTITYELQVGDLPGGRAYLADRWGWSEKKVRTFLDCLARHNMVSISQLKGQRLAIITICNYSKYQAVEINEGQQRANQGPTKGHTEEGKELKEIEKKESSDLFDEVSEAFEAYNRTAASCGLPSASKLTADRKTKIKARLKDYGVDGWKQALANIERSGFLTGQNDRGWKADIDYLVKPASFAKIHDGGFGNGRQRSPLQVAKATGKSLFEMIGKDGVLR